MLFVGYFEGLESERGIAWRCADSQRRKILLVSTPKTKSLKPDRARVRGERSAPICGPVPALR